MSNLRRENVVASHVLWREGAEAEVAYFVRTGQVRLVREVRGLARGPECSGAVSGCFRGLWRVGGLAGVRGSSDGNEYDGRSAVGIECP